MNEKAKHIDIKENTLRRMGVLLDVLLLDRTTKKNIIWATDSYESCGKEFSREKRIKPELVTGKYGLLIQPRAAKPLSEQRRRTKEKGEVFTPLSIIDRINKSVDFGKRQTKKNWQEYVRETRLEITCGEAPFITTRYNPTAHTGKLITLAGRVGFLDRRLRVVSKYCEDRSDWIFWAKEALKASYGYEWQGDNVLLARENVLYTVVDYYKAKFGREPTLKRKDEFAEIISWNIFQMDGLRYVVPMSCKHESVVIPSVKTLFEEIPERVEENECEGCKYHRPLAHNGKYVKIMDWETNKVISFGELPS